MLEPITCFNSRCKRPVKYQCTECYAVYCEECLPDTEEMTSCPNCQDEGLKWGRPWPTN